MVQKQECKNGHITQEERIEIYRLLKSKLSFREIWKELSRHHTTISREVNRNSIDKGWWILEYLPLEAEKRRLQRRKEANFKHVKLWKDHRLREAIEKLLMSDQNRWPDEILWRIAVEWQKVVSTATLYRFIRYDKPTRQRYLRHKHLWYKTQSKWNKRKKMYEDVPNIKERLEITNERWRIWDFEWDTVVSGRKYPWWLVSLADRKSRYYLLKKVWNLKAETINMAIKAMLMWETVESITFDNWVEFSAIKELPRQCYRADPYSSWQRWTNEKHNWYLRRFIPKWVNISDRTDEEILKIQNTINHKPRKILGYKTPYEVYHNINLTYIN